MEALKLNELGDFLAGAFGPLAIFWLILGFFQQGEELQHSVKALELQAEELKNSVAQQKAMVGITERQLNLDIEIRDEQNRLDVSRELPFFKVFGKGNSSAGGSRGTRSFRFGFKNFGADAIDLKISLDDKGILPSAKTLGPVERGKEIEYSFNVENDRGYDWKAVLKIECQNIRDQVRVQEFRIGNFPPDLLSCTPSNS
ncbi:hypothetical protein BMI90_02485 [Thioclava sp. L04-15]|uniref:hypothetical protein n=1 Tax=Thioclava sp. L04-15 TaxID=1915318 RepID=UPI0009C4D6D1|nr:hypothetical protein [Thioclava sp. L04-15]OOY29148.1 hypothetical protein BMI90_02485 [Thioclava sp. L04-15]TNE83848.1 MAG: hypothetical protein EP337_14660 [Paracoccaceae bacterium]